MYHFWFSTFKGEKLHVVVLHELKEALYLFHLLEGKIASSMFIHSDAAWQEIDRSIPISAPSKLYDLRQVS